MNLKKKIRREDFNEEMLAPSLFGEIVPFSKTFWKAYLDYCNTLRKLILQLEKPTEKCSGSFIYKQKLSDILGDWYKYDRLV